MISNFKPMLCASFKDINSFKPPYFVSDKIDGIRCIIIGGVAFSRKLIPFPNKYLQAKIQQLNLPDYLDGELVIKDELHSSAFRATMSIVNSQEADIPELVFRTFDIYSNLPFIERQKIVSEISNDFVIPLKQTLYQDMKDIFKYEEEYLSKGGEGLICKSPASPYKFGRSTLNENFALKLKRFNDSEATIIGFEPLYTNQNDAVINELGYIKRSSAKDGLVINETMGALIVKDLYTGVEFNIGSGFTLHLRKKIWNQKDLFLNKIVKYKYFPVGEKEKPRFPTFLNFV